MDSSNSLVVISAKNSIEEPEKDSVKVRLLKIDGGA